MVQIVAGCRQIYKVEQWNNRYIVFDSPGTDITLDDNYMQLCG